MPELPEVETVRRSVTPHVVGRRIEQVWVRERRLRQPIAVRRLHSRLQGRRILGVRRRAKYLLFDIEGGSVLMVHLGMSGRLGVGACERPLAVHDHVVWRFDDGTDMRLNDPRRFGLVDAFAARDEAVNPRLRHLGVEPLGPQLNAADQFAASRGLRKPVKNYLMDGTRIVGVGNIYACESLWRARIHPATPVGRVSQQRWQRLVQALQLTLQDAISQGGTTLRDFADANGSAGYFAIKLRVYDRAGEACPRCGHTIRRIVQAGRSTFYCPGCQRH